MDYGAVAVRLARSADAVPGPDHAFGHRAETLDAVFLVVEPAAEQVCQVDPGAAAAPAMFAIFMTAVSRKIRGPDGGRPSLRAAAPVTGLARPLGDVPA